MRKYFKRNRAAFVGALICIFSSNALAVVLQFFKGDVLDHAIAGETETTIKYAVLLISFILGEVLFFFLYKRFNARFVVGSTRMLKHDIFESMGNCAILLLPIVLASMGCRYHIVHASMGFVITTPACGHVPHPLV